MNKLALFIFIGTLLFIFALSYFFNISLPYRPCGGSTLRELANKCFPGFSCTYPRPECDGCGGICQPASK